MADPDAIRYLRIAMADLDEALKSWIHSRGGLAPFTHDLVALMDWLEESGTDVSPFGRIADLTFFAVQTRYDDSQEITAPDWPLLRASQRRCSWRFSVN